MPQLHDVFARFRTTWHFATSSPETGISDELSGPTLRQTDFIGRRRWLRSFYDRHYLLIRALLLTLVWEVVAELIGMVAFIVFPPSNDLPAFLPGQHSPLLFRGQRHPFSYIVAAPLGLCQP